MASLFHFTDGIISGLLRLGIKQGDYVAYVEMADSGAGFKYMVTCGGLRVCDGQAIDLSTAKQKAEEELRVLCSAPRQ
jgi:hypothetical protein